MAIAKLSIDLEARLANLQAGLDKAGLLAEQQADRMSAAFKGAQTAIVGVVGAVSAQQIVQAFNRVVDGLDALNDAADATGASIEKLSALEDIAARNGTAFDTVTDAVIKMNKALGDAKPGSDAAAVFKQLGLSVEELKRADPAEAFRRIALALNEYADDGNKARVVQELFGKSLKEVAPLLKDVAEQGQLNAAVTTEQAKAAEAFNKQVSALQKNVLDLARSVAGDLVVALNELFDLMQGKGAGKINEWLAVPLQAVTVLGGNVAFVLKGIGTEIGGIAAQAAAVARMDFSGARAIGEAMREDAEKARKEFDQWERRVMQTGMIEQASYSNEGRNYTPQRAGLGNVLGGNPAAAKKAAEERRRLAEFAAQQIVTIEEQAAKDAAEAWGFWEKSQLDAQEARAEAAKTQWQQVFEFIDAEQERAIAEGQAFLDAQAAIKKSGEDVGKDLALVFSSAASEAITKWEGVGKLIRSIGADIAQIALRETVTKPLSSFASESLKGVSLSSIGSWLASLVPKFDKGTDYVPRDMLAVIHKGERIVPAAQNQAGAYGGITIGSIDARGSDQGVEFRIQRAVRQAVAQSVAEVQVQANRGGAFARSMGRA